MSTLGDVAYPKTGQEAAPTSHAVTDRPRLHRPLLALSALMLLSGVASLVLIFVAPVQILGTNGWIKPLKFAISIAIFAFTIALVISLYPKRRWLDRVGTVIAALLLVEQVLIVAAVVRGTTSHFNASSPLNQAIFAIMGASIAIVWLLTVALGILVWRRPIGAPDQVSALRIGMVVGLVGMALAFLMTTPSESQLDNFQGVVGAHAVGVADGGPGLPILGWSTEGGDLRVPHFIGMHALQVLPILAFGLTALATRRARLRDPLVRRRLVRIAGLAYAALTAVVTWQALSGESVAKPSGPTLLAVAAIVVMTALASIIAVRGSNVPADQTETLGSSADSQGSNEREPVSA